MASIGKRDHYVQLQSRSNNTNAYNETVPNPTWNTDANIWVSINPLRGREYVESEQTNGILTHMIEVQDQISITDPDLTQRFIDADGLIYNIDYFARKRQGRYRIIECFCIQDGSLTT